MTSPGMPAPTPGNFPAHPMGEGPGTRHPILEEFLIGNGTAMPPGIPWLAIQAGLTWLAARKGRRDAVRN